MVVRFIVDKVLFARHVSKYTYNLSNSFIHHTKYETARYIKNSRSF
jgi:hypothetical protein